MITSRSSRRQWLTRVGAGTALLPFLTRFEAFGQASQTPKRILFVMFDNGVIGDAWRPMGEGATFSLAASMAALQPFREDLLVLSGLDMSPEPTGAHSGQAMLLSNKYPDMGDRRVGTGITLDQAIAKRNGAQTRFGSLEAAVVPFYGDEAYHRVYSYSGPKAPIPWEPSPYALFDRLFAGVGGVDAKASAALERRKSVLDRVKGDLTRARQSLGTADRALLDRNLQSIRELELSFVSAKGGCAPFAVGTPVNIRAQESYIAINDLQSKLLVSAFTCDATRVASLVWSGPTSGQRFTWLGSQGSYHPLSHDARANRDILIAIQKWYVEQFAALIKMLKAIPQPEGGTLFDSTLLVLTNALSVGASHSKKNLPIVMAGGGWHFKTGRHLAFSGTSHGKWLVSMAQAMGLEVNTFGDPNTSNGPLTGLTG